MVSDSAESLVSGQQGAAGSGGIEIAPLVKTERAMVDRNKSVASESSANETTSSAAVNVSPNPGGNNSSEAMMWEGWTQASAADEGSTSSLLPEIPPPTSRLDCQQSDLLSVWISNYLSQHNPDAIEHPIPSFIEADPDSSFSELYLRQNTTPLLPNGIPCPLPNNLSSNLTSNSCKSSSENCLVDAKHATPLHYWQAVGADQSPSSPLVLHYGLRHSPREKSDGSPWPEATKETSPQNGTWVQLKNNEVSQQTSRRELFSFASKTPATSITHPITHQTRVLASDQSASAISHHPERFTKPNTAIPGAMHTQMTKALAPHETFVPMQDIGWAHAGYNPVAGPSSRTQPIGSDTNPWPLTVAPDPILTSFADCQGVFPYPTVTIQAPTQNSNQLWLQASGEGVQLIEPPSKRPNLAVDHAPVVWNQGLRTKGVNPKPVHNNIPRPILTPPRGGGVPVSQAMEVYAVGPALNTNGKPRARRGSATDPQSVYARQRRERINQRLKMLMQLVPNGTKVDIVTMLDEAYSYVKFLEHQLELLKSDDDWMFATPFTYKGMDLSAHPSTQTQGPEFGGR